VGVDGTLYYLRRPWKTRSRLAPLRMLLDLLLMPLRLFAAIFNWLNFFSVRYGGRPLITSQGAQQRQMDARRWFVWGNLIDAAEQARNAEAAGDPARLVPSTWQLLRQSAAAAPEVIARGVCSFDLAPDGVVIRLEGPSTTRTGMVIAASSVPARASSR
jgi:hypothetical protein